MSELALDIYETLCAGHDLERETSRNLFKAIVAGEVPEIVISGILTALKVKGETPVEIAGAADALLEAATPFNRDGAPPMLLDTCGTGGDGAGTVNISTATALLLAELGLPVVKHGNRSVSSKCGSADVLEKVGVSIDASPANARRVLDAAGITFLFAPRFHAGVRHAMPVRRTLKSRTIFNLLGPLINPARPTHQLMGVYAPELCRPVAETLRELGTKAALVVHGSGLDEVAIHGATKAVRLRDGELEELELSPSDFGIDTHYSLDQLAGDDPVENAQWLRQVLAGRGTDAHNAAITVNAAAALVLTEQFERFDDAASHALEVLKSGRAAHRLNRFVEMSHGFA